MPLAGEEAFKRCTNPLDRGQKARWLLGIIRAARAYERSENNFLTKRAADARIDVGERDFELVELSADILQPSLDDFGITGRTSQLRFEHANAIEQSRYFFMHQTLVLVPVTCILQRGQ